VPRVVCGVLNIEADADIGTDAGDWELEEELGELNAEPAE